MLCYAQAVQNNGPNYFTIGDVKWGSPSVAHCWDEKHAKLFAAAPELLAALISIRESPQFRNRLENGIQQIVHSAIAKAV